MWKEYRDFEKSAIHKLHWYKNIQKQLKPGTLISNDVFDLDDASFLLLGKTDLELLGEFGVKLELETYYLLFDLTSDSLKFYKNMPVELMRSVNKMVSLNELLPEKLNRYTLVDEGVPDKFTIYDSTLFHITGISLKKFESLGRLRCSVLPKILDQDRVNFDQFEQKIDARVETLIGEREDLGELNMEPVYE